MKTFLVRSILGIFFGAFLALVTIFAVIYLGEKDMLDSAVLVKNALGTVFCGWFFTVTPLLFENEKLTLPIQTALHFLCVAALYFIAAFVIGWIPFTVKGFIGMLGIFIVIYAIIWFAFFTYFRQQAAKLNEGLNDL
ncbi:DUF3021 domain-containing protein [Lederbergia lenta]|uniref:Protein of uncharacterized function (DUF3021) n=1 Tax=Lederbergia lenta TaxID=1467 RepID=A0A2X4VGM9_LEDLE|nr:DUF3021 domain-containing protein [Lederbergia lenta]MCM3113285.1 DUF3021 domain-containing protein [Lederbergia lenta]MEC2326371.1 DUF3021 domain-containing protein [Lederbergia lenta]SQI51356.1 Protein of uncharacterised function (DUF3021) [Lederbergia lenta]